jgi:pimeloyl-ACP methyl ester carboxylesterase
MSTNPTLPTSAQSRDHTLRRSVAVGALALTAILGAAACGTTTVAETSATPPAPAATGAPARQETTTTTVVRPTATVDELVPVAGARMHVRCSGAGAVTVLLVAGFGDAGDSWASVEPAVAQKARVCSSSRFGLGTSDAPPSTQTFATEATDLRAALRTMNEPGPYVVVGHSFGGAEAVSFTAQNPDDVHGVMLLDASPTTWPQAVCAVPNDGTPKAQEFVATCAMFSPQNNPEHLDGPAAFAGVATIDSLGAVPMVVATRADVSYPGLAPAEQARLKQVWDAGQQHWLTLSSASRLVPVDTTNHVIQLARPEVVIDQITGLL